MKLNHSLQKWIPSIIAALAMGSSPAFAQYVICSFDSDISCVGGIGGSASANATDVWDATGNPGGSLYVTVPWLNQIGWQDYQISFNQTINMGQYINFECDIKVDTAHSTLDRKSVG